MLYQEKNSRALKLCFISFIISLFCSQDLLASSHGPCQKTFSERQEKTKESGLSLDLAKPFFSPIALYRKAFGKRNRNRSFKNGKPLLRKNLWLDDIIVQSGHNTLRKPEVIKKIIESFKNQNQEGIEKVLSDQDKIEFVEVRDSSDNLLWVELRGGHHRAIALYLYLIHSGRNTTVGELERLCPRCTSWKIEMPGSLQIEKVPLGGTPLEHYEGKILLHDSKKAPSFRTDGNNRSRTDVSIAESAFATMNPLTANRKVRFLELTPELVADAGGLKSLMKLAEQKAQEKNYFEVVMFAENLEIRLALRAVIKEYSRLNFFQPSLKKERAYIEVLENSGQDSLIPQRLKQVYQTRDVKALEL